MRLFLCLFAPVSLVAPDSKTAARTLKWKLLALKLELELEDCTTTSFACSSACWSKQKLAQEQDRDTQHNTTQHSGSSLPAPVPSRAQIQGRSQVVELANVAQLARSLRAPCSWAWLYLRVTNPHQSRSRFCQRKEVGIVAGLLAELELELALALALAPANETICRSRLADKPKKGVFRTRSDFLFGTSSEPAFVLFCFV